jgi:hypothetical protein
MQKHPMHEHSPPGSIRRNNGKAEVRQVGVDDIRLIGQPTDVETRLFGLGRQRNKWTYRLDTG